MHDLIKSKEQLTNKLNRTTFESKNTTKSIYPNESIYNKLANNLHLGLFKVGLDGRIIFANQYTVEALEFNSLEEMTGTNALLRFNHKSDRAKIISKLRKESEIINFETEVITKTGKSINVILSATLIDDMIHGIALNISSNKQLNKEIENCRSMIQSTLDSTNDGILIVDIKGKIRNYNKKFLRMWKIPEVLASYHDDETLVNYVLDQLSSPDDFVKKIEYLYTNKEQESFDILIFKDGRVFERYSKPHFQGEEITGRIWSFRDMTDRAEIDNELNDSVLKYKILFESANDAIFLMKGDRFIDCNARTEEIFGCSREMIIGQTPLSFSPLKQPDGRDSEEVLEELVRRAYNGENLFFEWGFCHCNGSPIDAEINLNRLNFRSESLIQVIVRDITQRKTAENLQNAVYEISDAANQIIDLTQLYLKIHQIIDKLIVARNFYIALYDPSKDEISFPYFVDEYDTPPSPKKFGRGLTEYVIRKGKPILVDSELFEKLVGSGEVEKILTPPVYWIGVPLLISNKVIGVLAVQSYSEDLKYTNEDKDFLNYVSNQVATAIERKRFEQTLQFTQFIIDHTGEAAIWMDSDGKLIYVNQATCSLLGYDGAKLLTMDIFDIDSNLSKENWNDHWDTLKSKGFLTFESIYISKSNRFIPVDILTNYVIFEGKECKITFARDISKRKQSEENLFKLRKAVKNSGEVIFLTDPRGIFTYVNPHFTKLYGYTEDEVIGKVSPSILTGKVVNSSAYQSYWKSIFSEKTTREELINKTKDGRLINIESLVSPILDKESGLLGFLAIQVDITDRKRDENSLLLAKEKAEEMNRLKTNFLANMSHELRTPMVGIMGYTDILKGKLADPELIEMSEEIYESSNRLLNTLNQILDLSRIESNNLDIKIAKQNITAITEDHLKKFESLIKKKKLYLHFKPSKEIIYANIDKQIYRQVLTNLIDNAIKFTDSGGITVEVNEITKKNDKMVEIKIIDTGVGISKECINMIFEEYRQVSEGFNRAYEGSGLGLTITNKFVKLMRGSISVKSEIGKGSTFSIKFPLNAEKNE